MTHRWVFVALLCFAPSALAFSNGITGRSTTGCATCHGAAATDLTITAPALDGEIFFDGQDVFFALIVHTDQANPETRRVGIDLGVPTGEP